MKVGIIYYSGTGINAYIASELGKHLEEQGHGVKLFRWTGTDPQELNQFDLLGFGAPCFSFYAPRNFLRFLKRLPRKETPFFLFSGYHGIQGHTLFSMYRILRDRGYRYTGSKLEITGIMSIRAWRKRYGKGIPLRTLYGVEKIEKVARDLSFYGDSKPESRPACREKGNILWDIFALLFAWPWQMAFVDGFCKTVSDTCTGCGLCWEVICPSGAITPGPDLRPRFNRWKCEGCSGCVNICPEQAIFTLFNRNRQPCNAYASFVLK